MNKSSQTALLEPTIKSYICKRNTFRNRYSNKNPRWQCKIQKYKPPFFLRLFQYFEQTEQEYSNLQFVKFRSMTYKPRATILAQSFPVVVVIVVVVVLVVVAVLVIIAAIEVIIARIAIRIRIIIIIKIINSQNNSNRSKKKNKNNRSN